MGKSELVTTDLFNIKLHKIGLVSAVPGIYIYVNNWDVIYPPNRPTPSKAGLASKEISPVPLPIVKIKNLSLGLQVI